MSNSASPFRAYLLAGIVALGLSMAWAVGAAFLFGVIQSAGYSQDAYEQIYVGQDGQPYILRTTRGIYTQKVLTLTGEAADVDSSTLLNPMYVSRRSNPTGAIMRPSLAAVNDGGVPGQYWYLVHDGRASGHAYGVGYDSLNKQVVGYFGRNGFFNLRPPRTEWFEVAGNSGLEQATPNVTWIEPRWGEDHVLHVLAEGKLWAADPARREVRAIADAPSGASLGWAWDVSQGSQNRPRDSYATTAWAPRKLLIRTEDKVTLVDPRTGAEATYSLPPEVRQGMFAGYQLADGNLLLVAFQNGADPEVVWLAPQKVVRREHVRLAQSGAVESGPAAVGWMSAAAAPFPLGQFPTLFLIPWGMSESGEFDSYWSAVGNMLGQTWPALLAVAAMGAAAAVAAYRRQQRFGLPHAIGWAVFAFLFGAPGWIAYRWRRTWPELENCPQCGHSVPHDRERCHQCLHTFPLPPMKGIEVFA